MDDGTVKSGELSVRKGNRNGLIEILRFAFALIVLMVHTHGLRPDDSADYPFVGGYIAVEFFLILSGFFCAKNCLRNDDVIAPGKSAVSYTVKQYFKLFPMVFTSVVIHYIIVYFLDRVKLHDLPYAIYEIALFPQSGIYNRFLNLPLWYLSAYIICLPLFLYLIKRFPDFFVNIGTIIIPLIIYGYICRTNIHLDIWKFSDEYMFIGLFRVFAGLCMGVNCYKLYCLFSSARIKKGFRRFVITLGTVSLLAVLAYCYKFAFTYADYFLVLLMTASVAVLSDISSKALDNSKAVSFLGKWSSYIYCCHWTVRLLIPLIFKEKNYYEMLPIYIVCSLVYSLIIYFLSEAIIKLIRIIKKKVML